MVQFKDMQTADYLSALLKPMLSCPDDLDIVTTQDAMGILLTVSLNKADAGLVIGKGGETARAIRHLVRIVGLRGSARVSVKINEPVVGVIKYNI